MKASAMIECVDPRIILIPQYRIAQLLFSSLAFGLPDAHDKLTSMFVEPDQNEARNLLWNSAIWTFFCRIRQKQLRSHDTRLETLSYADF